MDWGAGSGDGDGDGEFLGELLGFSGEGLLVFEGKKFMGSEESVGLIGVWENFWVRSSASSDMSSSIMWTPSENLVLAYCAGGRGRGAGSSFGISSERHRQSPSSPVSWVGSKDSTLPGERSG
jgi:hypothetical protein